MATLKMTERHKAMAYVLNREFGYPMTAIATLMGVAQSTISSAIKDFEYQRLIRNLEQELNNARIELNKLGYNPPDVIMGE
ncbi:hypothetical protein AB6N30_10975 [Fusobacterium animalis]|jgi:hypothetical protein|uniref:hypothetical protein n=1 Tax=Fusobacterium animalis TaxID=76859 RepID=UPI0034DE080C